MNKGKIIQIMGPVVDVAFPDELPAIKEALEVQLDGKRLVMEVSQHIGNNCVRCIMLIWKWLPPAAPSPCLWAKRPWAACSMW